MQYTNKNAYITDAHVSLTQQKQCVSNIIEGHDPVSSDSPEIITIPKHLWCLSFPDFFLYF